MGKSMSFHNVLVKPLNSKKVEIMTFIGQGKRV